MSKFTIMEYSFTKISGKTIGILVAAGLFFAGFSILYSWRQPLPQRRITPSALRTTTQTEAAPTQPTINTAPPAAPSAELLVEEIVAVEQEPEEIQVIEEIAPQKISFILKLKDNPEESFESWEEAKTRLEALAKQQGYFGNEFKYSGPDIILTIAFAPEVIELRSEEEFRSWLARVGDYIFARRILLVNDLAQVLRNGDLMRVGACDVDRRGCSLLFQQGELWEVSIRGLERHPEELKVVGEEIFLRALTESSSMAICEVPKVQLISAILKNMDKNLSPDQEKLSNAFLNKCILSQEMGKQGIKNNLRAFLPLVAFSTIPGMPKEDCENIERLNEEFFEEFYSKVVVKSIKESKPSVESLNKITEDRYAWIINRLRQWTKATNISSFLLRSLFNS